MKYTGWAVLIVGILIGLFGLFGLSPTQASGSDTAAEATTPTGQPFPMGMVLLAFSGLAVAAGLGMLLFGGSGVIKTRNPAVRN